MHSFITCIDDMPCKITDTIDRIDVWIEPVFGDCPRIPMFIGMALNIYVAAIMIFKLPPPF